MSILDGVITAGLILVVWLLTLFIRDDIATPDIPRGETHVPESGTDAHYSLELCADDDLELSWSMGVGDHR